MSPIWLHLCYTLLFFNFVCVENITASEAKSGPYRIIIMRSGTCKKFSYRLHRDPPIRINVDFYNTSTKSFLTRGNLNVTRNISNIKIKIKSYIWLNGKWRVNHLIDGLGCNEMVVPMLCSIFNVKFEKKHCTLLKGSYHFENIDTIMVAHVMVRNLEYGKTLWMTEIYLPGNPFQTVFCEEYETWILPA